MDNEILTIWIEKFENSNISVEEELEEVKGTISNEEIWGGDTSTLLAYKEWLEEKLKSDNNEVK